MTEAGWTRNKPTVAGWYWWRYAGEPAVVRVIHSMYGLVIEGHVGLVQNMNAHWLGPITPTDRQQGRVAACEWTYDDIDDYYETACKNAYCLADGTLKDNEHKYCPYCGGLIQLAQQAQGEVGDE